MATRNAGSGGSPSGLGSALGAPTAVRGSPDDASGSDIPSGSARIDREREASRADRQIGEVPENAAESQSRRQFDKLTSEMADSAYSFAGRQKNRAADRMGVVAQALKRTGQDVAQQGEESLGNRLGQAADQLDSLSTELHQRDIESILDMARDLVRRRPVTVFTVAVVGGFALSQLLKSSAEYRDRDTGSTTSGSLAAEGADDAPRSSPLDGRAS